VQYYLYNSLQKIWSCLKWKWANSRDI